MANIKIRGQTVDIDVEEELRQFDWGYRARWTSDKLIAASPFRYDKSPSFFVNLDGHYAGTWKDSGAYDSDWESGGFVKLLAFLRNESYEETEDYLIGVYGWRPEDVVKLPTVSFSLPKQFKPLSESLIERNISPYLLKRGINSGVQQTVGVGKGRYRNFTAIPWRLPDGRLANVKYRATRGKTFFYEQGGWPIRKLVWGADLVHKLKPPSVVLCEAEIDAMTWWSAGQAAIAVGGVTFTSEQADIIKRLPVEYLILGGDNDKAGRKFNEIVTDKLWRYMRLKTVDYSPYKDANECGFEKLSRLDTFFITKPLRM